MGNSKKVRKKLRSGVQFLAHSSTGQVIYALQQCVHRVIHILVRKKLRSWLFFLKVSNHVNRGVCFICLKVFFDGFFGLDITVENASDARCLSLCEGSVFD